MQEVYSKKNLQEKAQSNQDKEIYFFDESRFGTHSKQGLGWLYLFKELVGFL